MTLPAVLCRPDVLPSRRGGHAGGLEPPLRRLLDTRPVSAQAFNNGLDPDTTDGAINLPYALPNAHVEYLRMEPPGIPTAFWRSVGPSHNVFVVESS